MTIRTLVVDDEPLAVQGLELRLATFPDIEIVGRAMNGREAIRAIRAEKPDVVFLDVQMPGFDGFSVISAVSDIVGPLFVMVTAFSHHALRAFEAQVVDYLMKPVEAERLAQTMDRVRTRLIERKLCEEAERLGVSSLVPSSEPSPDRYERIINVKDQGQIFRVDVDRIEKIDAAGDYMCLTTADQTLVLRETMKDLERRLDPRKFQRVHRSTIVNLENVRQVKPHTNGECFLTLASGATVKVSRSYRDVVARFL